MNKIKSKLTTLAKALIGQGFPEKGIACRLVINPNPVVRIAKNKKVYVDAFKLEGIKEPVAMSSSALAFLQTLLGESVVREPRGDNAPNLNVEPLKAFFLQEGIELDLTTPTADGGDTMTPAERAQNAKALLEEALAN